MLLSDCKYESWFDQTYNETYLTVKRAGRILLVHLCPALLNDLDELLSCTYRDMSKKEWQLRKHPNITGWLIVAFRYSTSLAWIEGSTCITISGNLPVTDAKTMIHS